VCFEWNGVKACLMSINAVKSYYLYEIILLSATHNGAFWKKLKKLFFNVLGFFCHF